MRITITSRKGGCGKSTTAVHLSAYLAREGDRVLLVDGDPNRSAVRWAKRGSLGFDVVDTNGLASYLMSQPRPDHVVVDTEAAPSLDDLASLTKSCDLLIVPSTPDGLSLDTLPLLMEDLRQVEAPCPWKILLTAIPPNPSPAGKDAREYLEARGAPLFDGWIRRYEAFRKAPVEGCTVDQVTGDRNGLEGWKDYKRIGEQIYGAH